jgi:hypothetical protein
LSSDLLKVATVPVPLSKVEDLVLALREQTSSRHQTQLFEFRDASMLSYEHLPHAHLFVCVQRTPLRKRQHVPHVSISAISPFS